MKGSDTAPRDVVLARVREALSRPAPPPHTAHRAPHPAHRADAEADAPDLLAILPAPTRPWLPDGGATPAERMDILLRNLALLRAVAHRVPDLTAATELVFALARQRDWKRVAYHRHPLVEPLLAGVPCATHCVDDAAAAAKDALEGCDAGITACEALVAQTGSILVGSGTCGGRGLSVLPPVHVVIATADQLVATLGDALEGARRRHGGRLPSMLSFITGPSRTGDIERILVLGAHGPRELLVVIVG